MSPLSLVEGVEKPPLPCEGEGWGEGVRRVNFLR